MSYPYAKEPKLPWMIPVEGVRLPKTQMKANHAATLLQHMTSLNYDCSTRSSLLTGIMCTIGPSSQMPRDMEVMMEYGMGVARLNMIHGDLATKKKTIEALRIAANSYSTKLGMLWPLGIALEVRGSEMRTGLLDGVSSGTITLEDNAQIKITCNPDYYESGNALMIYVDNELLAETVKEGDVIEIDNKNIILRVQCADEQAMIVLCVIEKGGVLGCRKRVHIPGVPFDMTAIGKETEYDLQFAKQQEVDLIIIKRVGRAETIQEFRDALGEDGKYIQIISKIESAHGLEAIEEIIEASDGILLSKDYLATEMPLENVFLAMKYAIGHCIKLGKPAICKGEILGDLETDARPCLAATSDIATSVLDGAHCIMLHAETAIGPNPAECVSVCRRVCQEAEQAVWHRQRFEDKNHVAKPPVCAPESIAIAAVETSVKCNAVAIIVLTTTGRSATLISQFLPKCPIIAVTRIGRVSRQLQMWRAVQPLQYIYAPLKNWIADVNLRLQYGISFGKVSGVIMAGDAIVLVHGYRRGAGFTNSLRVVYASAEDTVPA